jgi:hypothetical protein
MLLGAIAGWRKLAQKISEQRRSSLAGGSRASLAGWCRWFESCRALAAAMTYWRPISRGSCEAVLYFASYSHVRVHVPALVSTIDPVPLEWR